MFGRARAHHHVFEGGVRRVGPVRIAGSEGTEGSVFADERRYQDGSIGPDGSEVEVVQVGIGIGGIASDVRTLSCPQTTTRSKTLWIAKKTIPLKIGVIDQSIVIRAS